MPNTVTKVRGHRFKAPIIFFSYCPFWRSLRRKRWQPIRMIGPRGCFSKLLSSPVMWQGAVREDAAWFDTCY